MNPKTILAAVDLSDSSAAVLAWAGLLARTFHAQLTLLYADLREVPPYFFPSQEPALEAAAGQHRAALMEKLQQAARLGLGQAMSPELVVSEGHPVETILAEAERRRPDLIVIGSHGRSGWARLRLGSVAENVPVWVAPVGPAASPEITAILCPIGLPGSAGGAPQAAAALAAHFGAQLLLLHAIEPGGERDGGRIRLCDAIPPEARRRCDVLEIVREGDAAEQILLVARERAVDLIVLGAHHRRLLEFTVLGATTERVIRHATTAVLVMPEVGRVAGAEGEPRV